MNQFHASSADTKPYPRNEWKSASICNERDNKTNTNQHIAINSSRNITADTEGLSAN